MEMGSFQKAGGGGRGGGGGKNGGGKGKQDITCHNCNKKGHTKKDCWAPGGGAATARPQGGGRGAAGGGAPMQKKEADKDKICDNCKKKGHVKANCWAQGGGAAGKGPKGGGKGKKGKGLNEFGAEGEPEQEIESLGLFNLELNGLDENGTREQDSDYKELIVTFDTGAGVSALPSAMLHGHVATGASGKSYVVANGSKVEDIGQVQTHGLNEDWEQVNATWRVTEPSVRKPLASAVKCMRAGNRVVLDLDEENGGSYIYNKKTKKRTKLYVHDEVIKFKMWIKPGKPSSSSSPSGSSSEMQAVQAEGKSEESVGGPASTQTKPFGRRARVAP